MAHLSSGPRGQLWVRAWLHRVCDLDTVGKGKFSANALLTVSPKRRDEAGVNGEVAERVEVCMEVARAPSSTWCVIAVKREFLWGHSHLTGLDLVSPRGSPTRVEVAAVQMGWGTINSQGAYISMPMHPHPILYANGPPCA